MNQKIILQASVLFFLVLISCNQSDEKKPNSKIDSINGIFIFKRGMTFQEIKDSLENRKIIFKILKSEEYPYSYEYKVENPYKYCDKVKVITVYNIKFAGLNLDTCHLTFFKDTVVLFSYEKYTSLNKYMNIDDERIDKFNRDLESFQSTLFILNERMHQKYGDPNRQTGSIDLSKTNPVLEKQESYMRVYSATWINKDSTINAAIYNHFYTIDKDGEIPNKYNKSEMLKKIDNNRFKYELCSKTVSFEINYNEDAELRAGFCLDDFNVNQTSKSERIDSTKKKKRNDSIDHLIKEF